MAQSEHKILVVDNESLVVEELVEFLINQGYSCAGCVGPQDALAFFVNNPDIDVVLSDFKMPGMTGVQLVETMRAQSSPGRIFEAIIFTGNAEKDDVIDALRAGVADYYQKPLNLNQLLNGIARVMAKLDRREAESKIKLLSHNLKLLSSSLSEICSGIDVASEERKSADTSLAGLPETDSIDNLLISEKLSPRQRDVAGLIARGLTNYQIACDLGISENTVKIYVSQILRIFNLNNRTQLALALEGTRESLRDPRLNIR
jgi:DNA-binding NarL/FixJ family response regulator